MPSVYECTVSLTITMQIFIIEIDHVIFSLKIMMLRGAFAMLEGKVRDDALITAEF